MQMQTLLYSLAFLGGIEAAPADAKRQTGSTCKAKAVVITGVTNNPGQTPQPPTITIRPSLTITQGDFAAWSNDSDMPNPRTISNNESGLFHDVEWDIDFGLPGIDGCSVNFGGAQSEGTTTFDTAGNNPRTETATCEVTFDC